MGSSPLAKTLAAVLGVALSPVYLVCLLIAVCYRLLGHIVLVLTDPSYAGLLDILESFFDRETGANASIINVVCNVRPNSANYSGEELGKELISLSEKTMQNKKALRLRCKIEQWMGLRFWRVVEVKVEEQIKFFEASNLKEFQDYLSSVANDRIHGNRLWEMHVSRNLIDGTYPVIMRGHHSVGDGYSLRQVLVESQPSYIPPPTIHISKYRFDPRKYYYFTRRIVSLMTDVAIMFAMAPSLCVAQYMRQVDKHSLRADKLSGKKILRWEKGNFYKLREVQKMTKNSVTEILMTGFSKSLDDLFKSRSECVDRVTVIFPLRKTQKTKGLANDFVPVGLKLPVNVPEDRRLAEVSAACRRLQNRPNYEINYFIPRYASLVFPGQLPKWVYKCTEFTSVFSNLPGPKEKARFEGFVVDSSFFFVPNLHDNNGLGVTFTTYDDQFVYGVILDRTLSKYEEDAQRIATGIKDYVDKFHASL